MLNDSEIAQYHENGYVTPDFRLPDTLVDSIRDRHQKLLQKHPEFNNYCPSLLAYDREFLSVAKNEDILDMVCQLIGPDIALWNSSFFAKPAGGGHATPWHQDGEYWPIRPLATCTVWIALDPATPENGCLEVIPGSHKQQKLLQHNTNDRKDITLNQELATSQYNSDEAEPIILETGQISLHDVYLVHGSAANNSTQSRRGMTLRIMPTTSIYDRDVARSMSQAKGLTDQSERTLYLLRGKDVSGANDFTQRH
jgi:ectoine hydroxylase-related dioxygenase (phytanoyl-CoA dioxygenase family)